jgi:membrane protein DedA with SNARE-associated domain
MDVLYQFCIDHLNYGVIFIFMTIESSFIPFPSEVVVPPAGFLVASGKLDFTLVVIFSTLGSLFGAFINYGLAYFLGRPVVYRFVNSKVGHMCMLSQTGMERAETYFKKNGAISTFVGRLLPGIRQLISIPAGIAKMRLDKFVLYTLLGAGIWNAILTAIGYMLHSAVSNIKDVPNFASQYGTKISIIVVCIVSVIAIIYFLHRYYHRRNMAEQADENEKIQNEEE